MKELWQKIRALMIHPFNAFLNGGRKNSVCRALSFIVRDAFFLGMCLLFSLLVLRYVLREEPQMTEKPQMISESELHERIRVGEVVRLREMPKKPDGTVCVLHPYSLSLYESIPRTAQINAYLKSAGYSIDEFEWGLVFAEDNAVAVSVFDKSGMALGSSWRHRSQAEGKKIKEKLPESFEPVHCVPVAHAAIAKIKINNQIYIIPGKMK